MKTLLLLLSCIVASSFGIALTAEGALNSVFQYALMGTVVISTLVLISGVTD